MFVPEGVCRFGEIREVWEALVEREIHYLPDACYLDKHPTMMPKMRALLADWLIEVCSDFVLHRETYYLALNFVDRYLTAEVGVRKSNLQAIGVTALFMAAKIQEIYPPPINQFVDITDRSVSEEKVLAMEVEMLTKLNWNLCPVTVTAWLEVYLQTGALPNRSTTIVEAFSVPKYGKPDFYRVCQLLDLSSLDYKSLRFLPSVLAACAIHLAIGGENFKEMVKHTGYSMAQLAPCLEWMRAFSRLLEEGDHYVQQPLHVGGRGAPKVPLDDVHNIQSHCNPFTLFERAAGFSSRSSVVRIESASGCSSRKAPATPLPRPLAPIATLAPTSPAQTPTSALLTPPQSEPRRQHAGTRSSTSR
jgi:cyclin E